jgi:hypothetical protein
VSDVIDVDAIVGRLEPGMLDEWSVKDVLVHIAGWQENAATVLGILMTGDSLDGDFDTDAYNAGVVADHREDSWDEVMAWLRGAVRPTSGRLAKR